MTQVHITNMQRALIKSHATAHFELKAAKWSGNDLIGKYGREKHWSLILSAHQTLDFLHQIQKQEPSCSAE